MKKAILSVILIVLAGPLFCQVKNCEGSLFLDQADVHLEAGRPDSAIFYFEKAKMVFKDTSWKNYIEAEKGLAFTYFLLQEYPLMESRLESALKIDRQYFSEEHENHAFLAEMLGACYIKMGKYEQALEKSKTVLALLHKSAQVDSTALSNTYNMIGVISLYEGNYEKAFRYYQQALDIRLRIGSVDEIRESYMNMADLLKFQEKHAEASRYYALSQKEIETSEINDLQRIEFYNEMGAYFIFIKDYKQAEHYLNTALKLSQQQRHYLQDAIFQNLGGIYKATKKYEEAAKYYRQSLAAHRLKYEEKNVAIGTLYRAIGENHLLQTEVDSALYYYQKSLVSLLLEYSDNDWQINPSVNSITPSKIEFINTLFFKGKALHVLYKKSEDIQCLKTALDCFNKIVALSKEARQNYSSAESKVFFATELQPILEAGIEIAILLANTTNDDIYLHNAFHFSEMSKSLIVLEKHFDQYAKSKSLIPDSLLDRQSNLASSIAHYEKELFTTAAQKNQEQSSKLNINRILFAKKEALEELNIQLEKTYPAYVDLKNNVSFAIPDEIGNLLDDNSIFIEYVIDQSKEKIYIISIAPENSLQFTEVDFDTSAHQHIHKLSVLLQSHNLSRSHKRSEFIQLSHKLYQQFIQPIEKQLTGKNKIIIVGEGMTNCIPFEVLLPTAENKPFHELNFLVKDYEISYHYSGTLFVRTQQKVQAYDSDFLAFAPVFSEEAGSSLVPDSLRGQMDSTFRSIKGEQYVPLLHTETEVREINKLFIKNRKTKTQLLLHGKADEADLKSNLNKNYRVVHIASHSFANIDYPKFSGIACTRQKADDPPEDGTLYVGEIYNLTINSDLVVLSSCESGNGRLVAGEGMLGLNRSFVYAGAQNVVFTLWKVYDKISSELMQDFYENIFDGLSYAAALRNAKLKLLEDPAKASPHYWSAFLLMGR
ncbi:MAG: CHAT domain-containing tetratricopeptide repeat protein [Bacteroidota bacterium]